MRDMFQIFLVILLLPIYNVAMAADTLQVDAYKTLEDPEKAVLLDKGLVGNPLNSYRWWVNSSNVMQVNSVALTSLDNTSPISIEQSELTEDVNCYLLMVDTSGSMRGDWENAKQSMKAWVNLLPKHIGIYQFSESFSTVVEVNSALSKAQLLSNVDTIEQAGRDTQLFLAVSKALEKAKSCPTSRKHLVIISDGDAEDKAYTLDGVIDEANAQAVSIHTVGFGDLSRSQTSLKLEVLKTLSEKTGGLYQHFSSLDTLRNNITNELKTHTLAGVVSVDAKTLPYGTEALLLSVKLTDTAGNNALQTAKVSVVDTKHFDNLLVTISQQFNGANPWLVIIGFGLLCLFVLLLLFVIRMRNKRKRADAEAKKLAEAEIARKKHEEAISAAVKDVVDQIETFKPDEAVIEEGEPYGWLVDDNGDHHPLIKFSTTIGRYDENDVTLDGGAVGRQHAILDYKEGVFIWTDRATTNKTKIFKNLGNDTYDDGNEVDGSEHIRPGDKVVCGNTTLEFILASRN